MLNRGYPLGRSGNPCAKFSGIGGLGTIVHPNSGWCGSGSRRDFNHGATDAAKDGEYLQLDPENPSPINSFMRAERENPGADRRLRKWRAAPGHWRGGTSEDRPNWDLGRRYAGCVTCFAEGVGSAWAVPARGQVLACTHGRLRLLVLNHEQRQFRFNGGRLITP